MKRIIITLLILVNIMTMTTFAANKPSVLGDGAILIDYSSGEILYEKNPHKVLYPASTTKILTAVIILEDLPLDEIVAIDEIAAQTGGSSMRLRAGEEFTVEELLFGLMVASGNDSAVALAIHHSGSVEEFAKVMTQRAADMGALNSNFTNPNGLPHEDHYTTAYDLAQISRHAMGIEKFRELVGRPKYTVPPTNYTSASRYLVSKNIFLQEPSYYNNYDRIADGIKTGWTPAAQNCFVGTAVKGDFRVISVMSKSRKPYVFDDTKKLFDYGFNNYKQYTFTTKDQPLHTETTDTFANIQLTAVAKESIIGTLPKDVSIEDLTVSIHYNEDLTLPIFKDDVVGYAEYSYNGISYCTVDIVASQYVDDTITVEDTDYYMMDLVSLYLL